MSGFPIRVVVCISVFRSLPTSGKVCPFSHRQLFSCAQKWATRSISQSSFSHFRAQRTKNIQNFSQSPFCVAFSNRMQGRQCVSVPMLSEWQPIKAEYKWQYEAFPRPTVGGLGIPKTYRVTHQHQPGLGLGHTQCESNFMLHAIKQILFNIVGIFSSVVSLYTKYVAQLTGESF